MEIISTFLQQILHLDQFLGSLASSMGPSLYILLFFVVFAETGLVITPFLPGDSLLFALGAMTTLEKGQLSFELLSVLLFAAALLGDNVNYFLGKTLGPKILNSRESKLFNRKHLDKAHEFYGRYGVRAVVLARFIPIVRTFVPFVAGIGEMNYPKFLRFSVLGAMVWIQLFLWAGRLFGNMQGVQSHFHYVILGVIALSLLPIVVNVVREYSLARRS